MYQTTHDAKHDTKMLDQAQLIRLVKRFPNRDTSIIHINYNIVIYRFSYPKLTKTKILLSNPPLFSHKKERQKTEEAFYNQFILISLVDFRTNEHMSSLMHLSYSVVNYKITEETISSKLRLSDAFQTEIYNLGEILVHSRCIPRLDDSNNQNLLASTHPMNN